MEGLEDLRFTLEEVLLAEIPVFEYAIIHVSRQATARCALIRSPNKPLLDVPSYDHPTVVANFRCWLVDGQDSRSNLPTLAECK
ncbi:N-carbamoylputrescine amidase [Pyrus ussuriensis x Pyrus communis]|uniref:N-carbamoylputrescine amidase n=1 Tax=Pyrus ussuriensis x Pyrus communis TaxID=2448454 RepID=A0A5N5GHT9_9ROSA|nr:N-carbamoylputrescine amidase [Pyrus ussuriensis x Pyrus communis]